MIRGWRVTSGGGGLSFNIALYVKDPYVEDADFAVFFYFSLILFDSSLILL